MVLYSTLGYIGIPELLYNYYVDANLTVQGVVYAG